MTARSRWMSSLGIAGAAAVALGILASPISPARADADDFVAVTPAPGPYVYAPPAYTYPGPGIYIGGDLNDWDSD